MSETPEIPLSRLRNLYRYAEALWFEGEMTAKDLWRHFVAIEINSQLAGYWYGQVDAARNYVFHDNAAQNDPCPLCVRDEESGEVIALCNFHKKIEGLVADNQAMKEQLLKVSVALANIVTEQILERLESYVEKSDPDHEASYD